MNIKITEAQARFILDNHALETHLIGSRLYGTNREDSDSDFLVIYQSFHPKADLFYPNYHQFQWDDVANQAQYMFTSEAQFYKNLFSGDSSINADIILFSKNLPEKEKLNICRTYKIIRAFIGFAKRDLKHYNLKKGKGTLFHIQRGLYCAEALLKNELPQLSCIQSLGSETFEELEQKEAELRNLANTLFEQNDLTLFPKIPLLNSENELENLLIDANNWKEFRY